VTQFTQVKNLIRHSPDDMSSEHQGTPPGHMTIGMVGKPRDREIIPRGCGGFATISPANLSFFPHQGAGLLSFAFEHDTVNRLTPASQRAVGALALGGCTAEQNAQREEWGNRLQAAGAAMQAANPPQPMPPLPPLPVMAPPPPASNMITICPPLEPLNCRRYRVQQ
jgi:hypothetical protein